MVNQWRTILHAALFIALLVGTLIYVIGKPKGGAEGFASNEVAGSTRGPAKRRHEGFAGHRVARSTQGSTKSRTEGFASNEVAGSARGPANRRHEGFQVPSNPTCTPGREPAGTDPLPPETAEERDAYDYYEYLNIPVPEDVDTTPLTQYETAGSLGDFDMGSEIPWDYDNLSQNPKDILWGMVTPICSQSIFRKAYTRAVFGSANNLEWDEGQQKFTYRSHQFGKTYTDPGEAKAIQFAEFFQDFATETFFEETISYWGGANWKNKFEIEKAAKEAQYAAQAAEKKAAKEAGKTISKEAVEAAGKKAYGEALEKATKESIEKIAEERAKKLRLSPTIIDDAIKKLALSVNKGIYTIFERTFAKKAVESGMKRAAASKVSRGVARRAVTKAILATIGQRLAKSALAKMAGVLATRLAAIGARMAATSAAYSAALAAFWPIGTIISVFLTIYTVSCITWIPAILNSYADPEGECPPGYFNLRDAVINSSGAGEVGWELLSNIPVIGDGMYAFGPYLCTGPKGDTVLRRTVYEPYYYYDSTLSLFFDEDRPRKLKVTEKGSQVGTSVMWTPMYRDKRQFHYSDPDNYPVWVDFAEKDMLDKMAQYYLDMSRRYLQVDMEGNYYYEYISKFYGIIASSMYSCDVQVELTRITLNPTTGQKIDEKVQPRPVDTGMRYSDRRFYFMIDNTKGAIDPSTGKPYIREKIVDLAVKQQGSYWDILMQDNRTRYVITGCTYTDLTAPDCQEVTAEGEFVGDAVIPLGPPGGTYFPPVLFNDAYPTEFPKDQTCDMVKSNYTRWTYRPANPEPGSKDAAVNGGNTRLQLSQTAAAWGPTPKYSETDRIKISDDISAGQRAGDITFQSMMGFLPFKFGFRGGMTATIIDTTGTSELLNCLWQDARNNTGTFVINGNLVTNQENFMWFRGPTIEWAPGYVPTLQFCNKTILLQTDCANRYALRRFIYRYNQFQKGRNSTRRLSKVLQIEPRQKTAANPRPMCVYAVEDVDTTEGVTPVEGTERIYRVGVVQETDVAAKTCAWKPVAADTAFLVEEPGTKTLPAYEPYILDSTRYDLADAKGTTLADGTIEVKEVPQLTKVGMTTEVAKAEVFRRKDCTLPNYDSCHASAMKEDLIQKFNIAHSDNPNNSANPRLTNIEKSWTRATAPGEDPTCVYYATFEVSEPTLDSSEIVPRTEKRTIEFTLRPTVPTPGNAVSQCTYDLGADSYPTKLLFGPIPKPNGWFDVPQIPPCKNVTFLRTGCIDDLPKGFRASDYADCSGFDQINELVTQFNSRNPDRKILRVVRASTPFVGNEPVCDYEVDMMRSLGGGKTMTNRERVRMILQARTIGDQPRDRCLYDLVRDLSSQPNSGSSLTVTSNEGALTKGYLWPVSFLRSMTTTLNSYIMEYLGYDIPGTLRTVSTDAKKTMNAVVQQTGASQTLTGCGDRMTCNSDEVLKAVMNRYNFDAAIPYPDGPQYGFQRRSIVEIRRAGIATPSMCHYEVIERIENLVDALKKPDDTYVRLYLRRFRFDLKTELDPATNQCTFTITPLVLTDIQKGIMDIAGNAYGIEPPQTQLPLPVKNPEGRVQPADRATLDLVKRVYERRQVNLARPTDPPKTNTVKKFTRVFQPRPNVIEYVAAVDHVYWDSDYGMYYTTKDDETYLVAKWEGAAYDVQAGRPAVGAEPTVEEFFPPEIEIRSDGAYKKGTATNLPFLYYEDREFTNAYPNLSRVVPLSVQY